ncbi:MAG: hypothetical protein P8X90_06135 [Desulfobacterales bacterium]|jgi:hypothetical protein
MKLDSKHKALRCFIMTLVGLLLSASAVGISYGSYGMVPKNILILMAGQYGLPAYDVILHEARDVLNAHLSGPLNLYAEYIDAVRFPLAHKTQTLIDFYLRKYDGLKIDLVIAIGPTLVPIIKQFGDRLFLGAPTVILDLVAPGADLPAVFRKPGMTGVFPMVETQGLVQLALALHPDTKHLVVVSGESDMDRMLGAQALHESRLYEGTISVQHLSGMPMADILRAVHTLPDHSVVLLMGLALCRTIIQEHGGRIRIENNADGGATATFELPVIQND